ncbi:strigolactone esterase D14-like [Prosopis cineraria]|uniref:strigolactone esterase D14-like n=1 Tax=Prosopis cineraria TaxID=364024 RepID=UPI00240FBE2C|nr:strigolactone esterase D14-like [Prosopis cineraria]
MVTPERGLSRALNVTTIGSASSEQTLVLAHGFGTDQSIWEKIVPLLTPHYRLVLFDWPFSGAVHDPTTRYSPEKYDSFQAFADDLIDLMTEMDLKAVTFAGHSMSAMIGCIASVTQPHLFKKLILVCGSPRYLNTEGYEGGFTEKDIKQLLTSIETNYEDWVYSFSSMAIDPNDAVSREKFQKSLLRMGGETALPLAKTVFLSDNREWLEKVEIPCTVIQPSYDMAVPHSVALYLAKKIKGKCDLEVIEAVGHFPQLTAHLKLVEVLKAALLE